MKFKVKAFMDNSDGADDPELIHYFDADLETTIPMVGDFLRWDNTGPTYKVVARHFDYAGQRCTLEVEEAKSRWRFN